jgi:hypothetical protein
MPIYFYYVLAGQYDTAARQTWTNIQQVQVTGKVVFSDGEIERPTADGCVLCNAIPLGAPISSLRLKIPFASSARLRVF